MNEFELKIYTLVLFVATFIFFYYSFRVPDLKFKVLLIAMGIGSAYLFNKFLKKFFETFKERFEKEIKRQKEIFEKNYKYLKSLNNNNGRGKAHS